MQKGDVKQALEKLMALEKQTRLAADAQSTKRVLVAIVRLCFDVGDWTSLNEHIILLTKRRGQLKMVCQTSVGMSSTWCLYTVYQVIFEWFSLWKFWKLSYIFENVLNQA